MNLENTPFRGWRDIFENSTVCLSALRKYAIYEFKAVP